MTIDDWTLIPGGLISNSIIVAAGARLAVQGMKRCLNQIARAEYGPVREQMLACMASEDFQEGLAALRSKRAPAFNRR